MKKNSYDFTVPRRQSRFAIIFIVLKFLRRLLSQVWPIVVALILGRRGNNRFDYFEMMIVVLGIFGMLRSVIAYYRYYYHITDEALIINSGILRSVRLEIPFDRIQSINFNENILHQAFGVVAMDIESAGSVEKEMSIDALQKDRAIALKSVLLQKKKTAAIDDMGRESDIRPQRHTIVRLTPGQLVKVGLGQNHLKLLGVIIAFFASMLAYAGTVDIEYGDIFREISGPLLRLEWSLSMGIYVILAIPFMVLYSVIRIFIIHYDLHFWRGQEGFNLVQGLFTRRQFVAPFQKIQIYSWSRTLFEKLLGIYKVTFFQARAGSSTRLSRRLSIVGCHGDQVNEIKEIWSGYSIAASNFFHVSQSYFYRPVLYLTPVMLIIAVGFGYQHRWGSVVIVLALEALLVFSYWRRYKKKLWSLSQQELIIKGGIFGDRTYIIPLFKIQNISLTQTPYQWRRGLATVHIHTAGGKVVIPYITHGTAYKLSDYLLYRVEISKRAWM